MTKDETRDEPEDRMIHFAVFRDRQPRALAFTRHLEGPSPAKRKAFIRDFSNELFLWGLFKGQIRKHVAIFGGFLPRKNTGPVLDLLDRSKIRSPSSRPLEIADRVPNAVRSRPQSYNADRHMTDGKPIADNHHEGNQHDS